LAKKNSVKNEKRKDDQNNHGSNVMDQNGNVIEFNQKEPKFPFLLRRFLEFFMISIICSVPFSLLYAFGFPKSETWAYRIMGLALIAFSFTNIYFLRAFFYGMGNLKVYFKVNLLAYTIFAALNIIVLAIFKDNTLPSVYTFMFMPMRFALLLLGEIYATDLSPMKFQVLASILTHFLMYFLIFASPLEMYSFETKRK